VLARRHVASLVSLVGCLLLAAAAPAMAQKPKPKPPPPGGVTPACEIGCIPPYSAPRVTPDGGSAGTKPANTGGYSADFLVRNMSAEPDAFNLNCDLSTGTVTCTGLSTTYVELASGALTSVTAYYDVGNAGAGTVKLRAMSPISDFSDNGYWNVTAVGAPGAPIVALRNHNGDNRDRSLCLTTGAGEAAAWGCGDLVVTHGLPAYATMGRERSLSLVYTSAQAAPRPLVAVAVTEGGNVSTPDSVHVELLLNGVPRATATYNPWGATIPIRQVALTYDAALDATGLYPFTFLVRNKYATGSYDVTVSDTLIVVNRAQSEFGAGWSLLGVEQLVLGQPGNKILWVGGDGSAKVYRNIGTNVWQSAAGGFRDTLRYDVPTATYTRTLRHGIQVKFDAQGRHIQTINRVGQVSTFTWTGTPTRLTSIQVPPGGSAATYTLAYDANNKLDRITDPTGRVLEATVASNLLTSLIDPDTYGPVFAYDAAGRMTSRTTRRGFATKFAYAKGLRVTQLKVPLNPSVADTAVSVFTPWDERGLAFGGGLQTAVDTGLVYTKIDGPRTAVADTMTFSVDRWGAPTRIVDPLGGATTIVRGDPIVPAVVTQVIYPDGRVTRMSWDARQNVLQTRDSTLLLANGQPTAVSTWTYASPNTKDGPDTFTDPEGVAAQYVYNTWGLLARAVAPNGHVTDFEFVPSGPLAGIVRAVIERMVPTWDTITKTEAPADQRTAFALNALGNVEGDTSAMGRIKTYTRDGAQRVTNVYDPAGHRVERVYDALNRVLQSIQHPHPSDPTFTSPLITQTYFTIDVLDSIVDPRGVSRGYRYDAANRRVQEVDDYGHADAIFYDRAGLVDSVRLRFDEGTTGFVTRFVNDEVGRIVKKTWPARTPLVADSILYTYDAMGRWLTAIAAGRRLTRTYYPTGTLRSEAQSNADGTSPMTFMYAYDRAGRRTWYRTGTSGDIVFSDSVFYRYDTPSGALRTIGVRWRRAFGPGTPPLVYDSVKFRWDILGRRDTLVYSNGTRLKFAYDGDGMMRLACADHPGGPVSGIPDVYDLTNYQQTVDVDGMILRTTNWNTGLSDCGQNSTMQAVYTQTFDSRHQMLTQSGGGQATTNTYDGSGNITRMTTSTSDMIHVVQAGHNRLTQSYIPGNPGVGTNYTYDLGGNRLTEEPFCPGCIPSQTLGARNYYYDGLGRMTGTQELACQENPQTGSCTGTYPFGNSVACQYDPLGRTHNTCQNGAPLLGFDGDNVAFAGASDQMLLTWTFVHGPGLDDPIMAYRHTNDVSNDKYWYFITDGQGRQFAVGDATGYDMSTDLQYYQNGGRLGGGTKNANTFGADRHHNPEMYKLSFFRNRFYDQQTGRWTQEDPIGVAGGLNVYAYGANNPAANIDPFGLKVCFEGTKAQKDSLKQAFEDATNTTIAVDGKGCVVSATPRGRSGFEEIQRRFFAMIAPIAETFKAILVDGASRFDPATLTIYVSRDAERYFMELGTGGACRSFAVLSTLGGKAAHEGIGHGYLKVLGGGLWGEGDRQRAEADAINIENQYLSASGKPGRCNDYARGVMSLAPADGSRVVIPR
jgi:RHS repeat-associated protein